MSIKAEDVDYKDENSFLEYTLMLLQGSTPSSLIAVLNAGRGLSKNEKKEFVNYSITAAVSVRRAVEPAVTRLSTNTRKYIETHFWLSNRLNFTKLVLAGHIFLEYASEEMNISSILLNAIRIRFGGKSIFSYNDSSASISSTRRDIVKKNIEKWKMNEITIADVKKALATFMTSSTIESMGIVKIVILPAGYRLIIITRCCERKRKGDNTKRQKVKSFYTFSRRTGLMLVAEEEVNQATKLVKFYVHVKSFNKSAFI